MEKHVIIIGGGIAGLSAGCYARAAGFRTTIIEHNLALGGVCTAWPRGDYVIDGCIHWLTGGPFTRLYQELGITQSIDLRTIDHWLTWRDGAMGREIKVTRDLAALAQDLRLLGPADGVEIGWILDGARKVSDVIPSGVDQAPELMTWNDQLRTLWNLRGSVGTLLHFRKPIELWARDHVRSETLRGFFTALVPEGVPALVIPAVLGYLERGYLSRPVGGTARFRDAIIATYARLGGAVRLHATVDEILVKNERAHGVRLDDGTMLSADAVISTSSTPETVLRLLGGRFGLAETWQRIDRWTMFHPLALVSFGVADPLAGWPGMMLVDFMLPFEIGGRRSKRLYLRICNDDASLAPPGHAVVQAILPTDYAWWASLGTGYQAAKERTAELALEQIESVMPGIRSRVKATDVATPLTFWHKARSWRGAYEGWIPDQNSLFSHVRKTLPGLENFYMAGQWVEPGGGVPMAVMSGRQAVQLLCVDQLRPFAAEPCRAT